MTSPSIVRLGLVHYINATRRVDDCVVDLPIRLSADPTLLRRSSPDRRPDGQPGAAGLPEPADPGWSAGMRLAALVRTSAVEAVRSRSAPAGRASRRRSRPGRPDARRDRLRAVVRGRSGQPVDEPCRARRRSQACRGLDPVGASQNQPQLANIARRQRCASRTVQEAVDRSSAPTPVAEPPAAKSSTAIRHRSTTST